MLSDRGQLAEQLWTDMSGVYKEDFAHPPSISWVGIHSVSKEMHRGKLRFILGRVQIGELCSAFQFAYSLAKCIIWKKNTKFALIAMWFEQFYEFQIMTYRWTFQDIERTI